MVHVPELFIKKFESMRSANDALGMGMQLLFFLLYIIGGCIIGSAFLIRKQYLITQPTYIISLILALLTAGSKINNLPISFMNYQTTNSLYMYYFQYGFSVLITFIGTFSLSLLLIAAAEGFDRLAFGQHVQFLKIVSSSFLGSINNLYQTLFGYAGLGISFGLVTGLYYILLNYFHWWAPADTLVDPSVVATYIPFITPLAGALQAGIIEEALFRALPLSVAALLGRYYKKERLFILLGILFQAFIFSGMHVNYPQLPAYFRLVEIFIPACLYGIAYLIFGLYPVIMIHVLYDFILMSLSIFTSDGSGMLIQKIIIVLITFLPLIALGYHFLKQKKFNTLDTNYYNDEWTAPEHKEEKNIHKNIITINKKISGNLKRFIALISVSAFLITCFIGTQFKNPHKKLTLSRNDAIFYANEVMEQIEEGKKPWDLYACALDSYEKEKLAHAYVWQTTNAMEYETLKDSYLSDTQWIIRYAQFRGNPEERMEQYYVCIDQQGSLTRLIHILPENTPLPSVHKHTARSIALKMIEQTYNLTPYELKEISALETDQPRRKDFTFIFQDVSADLINKNHQARIIIKIAGDTIVDYQRTIFTPETWLRSEKLRSTIVHMFDYLCLFLFLALLLFAYGFIMQSSIHTFNIHAFLQWFLPITSTLLLNTLINNYRHYSYYFVTTQSYYEQLFKHCSSKSLLIIICIFFLVGFISQIGETIYFKIEQNSYFKMLLEGFGAGSIISLVLFGTVLCTTTYQPTHLDYTEMSSYFGLLHYMIQNNLTFFIFSILGMVTIQGSLLINNNLCKIIFNGTILATGFVTLLSILSVESIPYIIIGSVIGTIIISSYLFILNIKNPLVAIPASMIFMLFCLLKEYSFNAHYLTSLYIIITSLSLIISGLCLFHYLFHINNKK